MFGSYEKSIDVIEGVIGELEADAQAQPIRDNLIEIGILMLAIERIKQAEALEIQEMEKAIAP